MGRQLYLTSIKLFFGSFCPILISYDLKSAAEGFVELLDINHILAVDKAEPSILISFLQLYS